MKIVFVIRTLIYTGAERQLVNLAKALSDKHEVHVIEFYKGPLGIEFEGTSVQSHQLNKKGRWDALGFLFRMYKTLKKIEPDIVHGYMDGANISCLLMKPFFPKVKLVWGVRASNMSFSHSDQFIKFIGKAEGVLSRFADLIIFNSKAGLQHWLDRGLSDKRTLVIPNGIDINRFKPDAGAREEMRKKLGLHYNDILIGIVGRLALQKDHKTFLKAAQLLSKQDEKIKFICIGVGPDDYKRELIQFSESLGLNGSLSWWESQTKMEQVYQGLDILTSSSAWGEGFSNVVGEAMACGIPCVVTDVGDSAWIVGEKGIVVPPENPEALANGIMKCVQEHKSLNSLRERIVENFSVEELVNNTEKALLNV